MIKAIKQELSEIPTKSFNGLLPNGVRLHPRHGNDEERSGSLLETMKKREAKAQKTSEMGLHSKTRYVRFIPKNMAAKYHLCTPCTPVF